MKGNRNTNHILTSHKHIRFNSTIDHYDKVTPGGRESSSYLEAKRKVEDFKRELNGVKTDSKLPTRRNLNSLQTDRITLVSGLMGIGSQREEMTKDQ